MKRLLILAFLLSFLLVGCRDTEQEMMKKPVIYLYPEFTQEIEVKLDYAGELTCTYPEYKDGWHIVAHPNGKLENKEKKYAYSAEKTT